MKEWLAADADSRAPTDASLADGVACDDVGCVTALADGRLVSLALQPDAFSDDCSQAILIITTKRPPKDCAAEVIDQNRLQKSGATALRQTSERFVAQEIRPHGVDRPWAPAAPDMLEAETGANRSTQSRPVDATPVEADVQIDEP